MTRSDLEYLVKQLRAELVKRQALGGFDAHADTIVLLTEAIYKLSSHLLEQIPRQKKADDKAGKS